eukprot:13243619-Alexandrium_andersonii.AAC.1
MWNARVTAEMREQTLLWGTPPETLVASRERLDLSLVAFADDLKKKHVVMKADADEVQRRVGTVSYTHLRAHETSAHL